MATRTTATKPVVDMPGPAPVDNLPAPTGGRVQAIVPASWSEITAIASAIARARMAPKSYCAQNGDPLPDKIAVAILHGMEVGFTPMASLQSIAVINGMPSIWGDGMMAVVRASGFMEDLQEGLEINPKDGLPLIAWCKIKRRGETSWKERSLTWPEVMRAGWANKDGPWKQTPGRMMTVRVRGWLMRDMFADVLRGLHSAEEAQDMVDVTPQGSATTTPPEEPKRSDPKYNQPSAGGSPVPAEKQPEAPGAKTGNAPSEAGGDKRDAEGQSGSTSGVAAGHAATKPGLTDTTDLNAAEDEPQDETIPDEIPPDNEPLVFEKFKTFGDLIEFSEGWLEQKGRSAAEGRQWHEFYKEQLAYGTSPKYGNVKVKEAINSLLAIYGKVIAQDQQ